MGPLLALGIVVMMACGLTLLPRCWPRSGGGRSGRRSRARSGRRGRSARWTRIAALVRRRPVLLALVCSPCSALGALGNLEGRGYLDLSEQYRDQPESVQGRS